MHRLLLLSLLTLTLTATAGGISTCPTAPLVQRFSDAAGYSFKVSQR